jgi:hypothetical protein
MGNYRGHESFFINPLGRKNGQNKELDKKVSLSSSSTAQKWKKGVDVGPLRLGWCSS